MADAALQPVAPQAQTPQPWSLPVRLLFRFAFCYWLSFWTWVAHFPFAEFVLQPYTNFWHAVCPWFAIHIFHLSGQRTTYFQTGSGDTTLDYIQSLIWLVLAAVAALIWSLLDRRRPDYRALHGWLRLLLRYALIFTLFGYRNGAGTLAVSGSASSWMIAVMISAALPSWPGRGRPPHVVSSFSWLAPRPHGALPYDRRSATT